MPVGRRDGVLSAEAAEVQARTPEREAGHRQLREGDPGRAQRCDVGRRRTDSAAHGEQELRGAAG